jgi:hypothetical protein
MEILVVFNRPVGALISLGAGFTGRDFLVGFGVDFVAVFVCLSRKF